jgi:NarL family two-component system response regulator LiaR
VHYFDEQHTSQVWTHRPLTGVGRTDRHFGRRPSRPGTDGDAGLGCQQQQHPAGPRISARRTEPRCAVEVLHLVSGGKTDREIGEELFISIKTVGNHVGNILTKTNSANRTEAATFANQHGLVTPDDQEK